MEWIMRPHTLSPLPPFDWLFLTDAGLATDLIYNQGIDLPFFASISPLRTESGRQALKDYCRPYLELAARHGALFVIASSRWRAIPRWAAPFCITSPGLHDVNSSHALHRSPRT